jgi:site-specific recombinase XerC
VQPAVATVGFDDAVAGFLDYLSAYRGYSIHTVKAYARDLREFRRLLARRYGSVRLPLSTARGAGLGAPRGRAGASTKRACSLRNTSPNSR